MDGVLITATAAALAEADRTTTIANTFVRDVAPAQEDLEPVLFELFALNGLLTRIRTTGVPAGLQSSVAWVIRSCSDICKRFDVVLSECGTGPHRSGRWALSDAPVEVRELKMALEACRRTIGVVVRATETVSVEQADSELAQLRRELMPDMSRLDALLVSCLDAVESYLVPGQRNSTYSSEDAPSPKSTPTTPSIQDAVKSFRQSSSIRSFDQRDSIPDAMAQRPTEEQITFEAALHLPLRPLETINDEDVSLRPGPHMSPPTPRLNTHRSTRGSTQRPAPIYSLFPPASPPPTKSLPPIPPVRSPLRPGPSGPSTSPRAHQNPLKTRSSVSSDVTLDSKYSSLSSAPTRLSASSQGSYPTPAPRSSSYSHPPPHRAAAPRPVTAPEEISLVFDVIPLRQLETKDKEASGGGVYAVDTSPTSTILASRHGKFHVKLWDLPSGTHISTIKVPFYVQAQARSREFFIRSHTVLSETLNLAAIATNFGHTLEVWDWAKRKKLQTISEAYRWASARGDMYESQWYPLAAYREDEDAIKLYPASPASSSKKPFGKARTIELRRAGLPHTPKLPELAYSATGPLLVAAAGPRPPRPGAPPPAHAALLMAWQLDGDARLHSPYRYHEPRSHPELENSLPLLLATYGSFSVSIWEGAKFRTIGKPGAWQVEPVSVTERIVLVWDFGGAQDKTRVYHIPAVRACISPDCRFVAYCDPGGPGSGDGALVVLDAIRGGRELWRLDGVGSRTDEASSRGSHIGGRSFETRRSARSSSKSDTCSVTVGGGGLELLAADLGKVTELAFSGDGNKLFVGDVDGGVSVYEIREGIGMAV